MEWQAKECFNIRRSVIRGWQKTIEEPKTKDHSVIMPSGVGTRSKSKKRSGLTYKTPNRDLESGSPPGVRESYFGGAGNQKIETLLTDIVTRLERIEEKIDETVYPPESAIRPEYIRKVKKAQAEISRGKATTYRSMNDFIQSLTQ